MSRSSLPLGYAPCGRYIPVPKGSVIEGVDIFRNLSCHEDPHGLLTKVASASESGMHYDILWKEISSG